MMMGLRLVNSNSESYVNAQWEGLLEESTLWLVMHVDHFPVVTMEYEWF